MSLADQLAQLEAAGLIRLRAALPELEYIFRHALTRDAAYTSLLNSQRRAVHRAAGEALLALYQVAGQAPGAVPEPLAPILAYHYATAGEAARAWPYYLQAGEAAFGRYANAEAADHFARALDLALANPALDPGQLRHLFTRLGRAYELSAQLAAARQVYERMESVAEQRHDRALRLAALTAKATLLSTASYVFDEAGAQAALEQARGLARELDDHAAETHINWTLLLRNTMLGGDPDERLALGLAALASARALGLREQLAYVLTDLWYAQAGLSRWDEAAASLSEAQALWRALGNAALLSDALSRSATLKLAAGEYAAALSYIDESYAAAEQIDSPHMRGLSRVFAGPIYFERGQLGTALAVMHTVVALAEQTGNVTALIGTRADLALAYGFVGQPAAGLAFAQQALEAGRQFIVLQPWAAGALARLHTQRGDLAAAEAALAGFDPDDLRRRVNFMFPMWGNVGLAQIEIALAQGEAARAAGLAERFLSILEANQIKYLRVETLALQGRALLALGQVAAARAALEAARSLALALGGRRHLWGLLTSLAAVAEAEPDLGRAAELRLAARTELDWLTAQLPPAQRAAFLAQAERHAPTGAL